MAGALLGGVLGRRMGSAAAMRRFATMNAKGKKMLNRVNKMGPLRPAYQAQIWQNLMQNEK